MASIATLYVALLAGGFTTDRLGIAAFPGEGVEVRWFLIPAAFIVGVLGLTSRLPPGDSWPPRIPFIWFVLVESLFGITILSIAWAPSIEDAVPTLSDLLALALLLPIEFLALRASPNQTARFMALLLVGTAAVYFAAGVSGSIDQMPGYRWSAFAGGPNVFVRIMVVGLISAIYLWSQTSKFRWLLITPFLLLGALASGSRGGLVAMALAYPTALLFTRLRRRAIVVLILVPMTAAAIVAASALLARGSSSVAAGGLSILETSGQRLELTLGEGDLSLRDRLFTQALAIFESSPLIGGGIGSFKTYDLFYVDYPHNLVLQIASETGLVGLALLLGGWALVARHAGRGMRPEHGFFLSVAALHFFASLFSGDWYDSRFMWLFLLLFMMTPVPKAEPNPTRVRLSEASGLATTVSLDRKALGG